jgi:hypothetical protein
LHFLRGLENDVSIDQVIEVERAVLRDAHGPCGRVGQGPRVPREARMTPRRETEDRRPKTEDRRPKTEDRRPKTDRPVLDEGLPPAIGSFDWQSLSEQSSHAKRAPSAPRIGDLLTLGSS